VQCRESMSNQQAALLYEDQYPAPPKSQSQMLQNTNHNWIPLFYILL